MKHKIQISNRLLSRSTGLALALMCLTGAISKAQTIVWSTASGGNGHAYTLVQTSLNWEDAKAAAEALGGHLATLTSIEENQFVDAHFGGAGKIFWIGGRQFGGPEPSAGWTWVTGEPFVDLNWNSGEPNNGPNDSDHLEWREHGWNDRAGFFALPFLAEIEVIDTDGDGIPDADDQCPNSDTSSTVVVDGCDSGVSNFMIGDTGCFVADLIADCAANAGNHGDFVSSVSEVTNTLKKAGLLSGKEKGAIQSCAAKSALP